MQKVVKSPVRHSVKEYVFPVEETISHVQFSDSHMIVHLQDGRFLGIPLKWIPTLANATPADREKVSIGHDGHTLHWNPDEGESNEDLRIDSFMRYDVPDL